MKLTRPPAPAKKMKAEKRGRGGIPPRPPSARPKNKIGVAKRFRRLGIKTSKQNNFLSIFYHPPTKFFLKVILIIQ